ncbi:MAG: gliding motility lipoprotein GldH [Chitinophagales bacterium]
MNRIALMLFVLMLTTACSMSIYRKFIKIPSAIWNKENKVVFKVEIDEPLTNVDVMLAARVDHAYQFRNLKTKVTQTTPKNDSKTMNIDMPIKDETGKHLGSGTANLWDVEMKILENVNFAEIGTYEFEVQHDMAEERLILVVDVGLIIKESKK